MRTSTGLLILPEVWRAGSDSAAAILCHRSRDGGSNWQEGEPLRFPGAADPVVSEIAGERLLLVTRQDAHLARSTSADGGATWSAPEEIDIRTDAVPPFVARHGDRLALLWTDPEPDTLVVPPRPQALRLAWSGDEGRTWRASCPLVLRPGRRPLAPALVSDARSGVLVFEERCPGKCGLEVLGFGPGSFECALPSSGPIEIAAGRRPGRYSASTRGAREALRVWCAHTMARPQRARRLFVEGYFMRALAQAHAVLGSQSSSDIEWLDTRRGLEQAIVYADTMLANQLPSGVWPVGYEAIPWADMGAALGLFATLEPWVDAARLERYVASEELFLRAMHNARMLLDSGAVGLGQMVGGRLVRPDRNPYLVSTALVGIEVRAWLYHRTRNPDYKQAVMQSLEYTLSQIGPDGFVEQLGKEEGSLRIAGYVEEGWMAADLLLDDPAVLQRLKAALPPHIEWLLRAQRPDGTWDAGAKGEYARTPAIVDFLVWYDQRCEARQDVRDAVRRASQLFLDPDRWVQWGLLRQGEHNEVLRAVAGRSLVALAAEKFVF